MCSVARNYKSQRRYLEILEENSWPKCELTFWGKLFFNVMLPTGRVLAPIVIIQHVAQQNFIKNCHKMTSYKWIFSPQTLVALKIVVKDGLSLKLEPFSFSFIFSYRFRHERGFAMTLALFCFSFLFFSKNNPQYRCWIREQRIR